MDWVVLLLFTLAYSFQIYKLGMRIAKLEDEVRELKK